MKFFWDIVELVWVPVLFIIFMVALFGCSDPRVCLHGHEETEVIPAYTQMMLVGKIWVPVHHPEKTMTRFVCDEYEDERGWQK